ncbi:glycosyltransferase family 4 protein [Enterococcus hirae]
MTTISNTLNAFLIPHIDQLIKNGHEVSMACALEQPLASYFSDKKIPVFQIPFNRNPLAKSNLLAYKKIKQLIKEENIDIVHTHTPVASMVTRLACKRINIPIYYTAHGFHFYQGAPMLNWFVYYPVEKYLSRYTSKLITINQEDYLLASQKFKATQTHLIQGVGIQVEKFEKTLVDKRLKSKVLSLAQPTTKVLLSVGELNKNKNHELVIHALDSFKDQDFHYFICGTGPLKQTLEQKIKFLGLEKKVSLLGYRKDIIQIMKMSDLFLFPSLREGLPVSIMEAMSVGLPVVASNIRGNKDLIYDENTGKLFDVKESEELVNILQDFFAGTLPVTKYSENAAAHIQQFSENVIINQVAELYETL